MTIYLIAAEQLIDEQGSLTGIDSLLTTAEALQLQSQHYTIDALAAGWDTPLARNHFRSGNGPLQAIAAACDALENNESDLIVISGKDFLRSDYDRQQRHQLMEIYPDCPLPEAYTQLAKQWCENHGLTLVQFKALAEKLFENYLQTYTQKNSDYSPDEKWLQFITELFRGVDCANPMQDYHGQIILAGKDAADKLNIPESQRIEISGIAVAETEQAGLKGLHEISQYDHLQQVIQSASQQAKLNIADEINQTYLEVYTCFPVVPLALLYAAKLAHDFDSANNFIEQYPLTITGGMNLAKAAWNNPVLRAVICLHQKLQQPDSKNIAVVHGNGGLGEKQGLLILRNKK